MRRPGEKSVSVLIVEDEAIIARNIERSLDRMGYEIQAVCTDSSEVYRALTEATPDVVLMDIRLQGEEDGVAIAERLRDLYALPVVYLSALMDDETLERAKITQPFGYIAKPFSQRELQITLEIALYKAEMEHRIAEQEIHIQHIIDTIRQGFCLLDAAGRVRYANKQLGELVGCENTDLIGRKARDFAVKAELRNTGVERAWRNEQAFEMTIKPISGNPRTVIITPQHLQNGTGTYAGTFLSVTDVASVTRWKTTPG